LSGANSNRPHIRGALVVFVFTMSAITRGFYSIFSCRICFS
jgi:hypothetical protein